MTCTNCSNSIEKIAQKMDGIKAASVSYINSSGVFLVENEIAQKKLIDKIKALGYGVLNADESAQDFSSKELKKLKLNLILSIITSLSGMALMLLKHSEILSFIQLFLGVFGIFYCGRGFFIHAFLGLKSLALDMNTLVALGSLSAFLYSFLAFLGVFESHFYFAEASMIISFVLFGKFLEEKAKTKANEFVQNLQKLELKTSKIIDKNGQIKEIPSTFINAGDEILLAEADSLSVDGVIVDGRAEVDTSFLNGEFVPVLKQKGDSIEAGSIIISGKLRIKATKKAIDSKLESIKDLIFKASSEKMPINKITDKISAYFVGFILILALGVFVFYAFKTGFHSALFHASALLLISCPCALGLATPIALSLALSNAAKHFILIKNPAVLELFSKLKFVLFDKTGTLSQENLSLYAHNLSDENFKLVQELELFSSHPIAKALCLGAVKRDFKGEFENIPARGLIYKEGADSYYIGNEALLRENHISISQSTRDFISQNSLKAPVLVFFAKNDKCLGALCLANELKSEAKGVAQFFKARHIVPVILSGDNEKSVSLCAKELDIKEFYANLKPEDKLERVKELEKQGVLMFIGDGLNDAAALSLANVSVAMNAGSNLAKLSGDIILMKNNLNALKYTYKLCQKCFFVIKINLFWAFFYNALCIPIAAGFVPAITLSPHLAALAMCFSSLSVVLNSLRLRKEIEI